MKKHFLVLLTLLVLIFTLYLPAANAPFMYDSITNIKENNQLKNTDNIVKDLFTVQTDNHGLLKYLNDPARPLTFFTFYVNYYFHKDNPLGFRILNMIFLAMLGFMIYLFLKTLLESAFNSQQSFMAAFIGSLILTLHPISVHVATYVYHRSEILVLIFYLASLFFYYKNCKTGKTIFILLSFTSFIMGLCSKQIIIVLPFVILFFDYLFCSECSLKSVWKNKFKWLPFLIVFPLYQAYRLLYLKTDFLLHADISMAKRISYIASQPKNILLYIVKSFFPNNLQLMHYQEPLKDFNNLYFIIPTLLLLVLMVISIRILLKAKSNNKARLYFFGLLFFFINILPTSSIFVSNEVMADRRLFVPFLGIIILMCVSGLLFFNKNKPLKKLVTGLTITLLFINIAATIKFNLRIKNPINLYSESIKAYPKQALPYMNLGTAYANANDFENAKKYLDEAQLIDPNNSYVMANLAIIYKKQNMYKKALRYIIKAYEAEPSEPKWQILMAEIYKDLKNIELATKVYERLIADFPALTEIKMRLIRIFIEAGNPYRALDIIDSVLLEDKNNIEYNCVKAAVLLMLKKTQQSKEIYLKVLQDDKNNIDALHGLGMIAFNQKDYATTKEIYQKLIRKDATQPLFYNNMGSAFLAENNLDQALIYFEKAIKANPKYIPGYMNLAQIYLQKRNKEKAKDIIKQYLKLDPFNKKMNAFLKDLSK